jgi:hypothetical protein
MAIMVHDRSSTSGGGRHVRSVTEATHMRTRSSRPEMLADDAETLTISPEKVCFIVVKAREFDAKDQVTEPDPGSNPSDDGNTAILEDHDDDPVVEELTSFINCLSHSEKLLRSAPPWTCSAANHMAASRSRR